MLAILVAVILYIPASARTTFDKLKFAPVIITLGSCSSITLLSLRQIILGCGTPVTYTFICNVPPSVKFKSPAGVMIDILGASIVYRYTNLLKFQALVYKLTLALIFLTCNSQISASSCDYIGDNKAYVQPIVALVDAEKDQRTVRWCITISTVQISNHLKIHSTRPCPTSKSRRAVW